jgi:hypothetical protein
MTVSRLLVSSATASRVPFSLMENCLGPRPYAGKSWMRVKLPLLGEIANVKSESEVIFVVTVGSMLGTEKPESFRDETMK